MFLFLAPTRQEPLGDEDPCGLQQVCVEVVNIGLTQDAKNLFSNPEKETEWKNKRFCRQSLFFSTVLDNPEKETKQK